MAFKKGDKPPGSTPFQKGKSGNPRGKKPGTRNRATVLRALLDIAFEYAHPVTGETVPATVEDAIAAAQVAKAITGDLAAAMWLFDGAHGKLSTGVDLTTNGKDLPAPVQMFLPYNGRDKP